MGKIANFVAGAAAAGACGWGCTLILDHRLNECSQDADCAGRGPGLACVQNQCVTADAGVAAADPDCSGTVGVDGADSLRLAAVIGLTTSTGEADPRGPLRANAIALAINGLNNPAYRAPTDPNYFVRLCDDHGSTTVDAQKATELVGDGYVAFITGGSSSTLAVSNVAAASGIPTLSFSGSSSQLSTAGAQPHGGPKLVWSVGISDSVQAQVLGQLAADGGYRSAACISLDSTGFQTLYSLINDAVLADTDGGLFVSVALYSSTTGPAPAVVQILDGGVPDLVLPVTPVSDSKPLFDAWFASAPKRPAWLFTDNSRNAALYQDALPDGGVDASRLARLAGSRGTGPAVPRTSSQYQSFLQLYLDAYGVDPSSVSYVPNAYDATLLLAAAAAWARANGGATPEAIARGMSHLSAPGQPEVALDPSVFVPSLETAFAQGEDVNVAGASGQLDFDPTTGIAPCPVELWTLVADAGFATLAIYDPLPDGGLVPQ
jgi:ABC-type branched-subunit amino acid transport system substrate-binding protein